MEHEEERHLVELGVVVAPVVGLNEELSVGVECLGGGKVLKRSPVPQFRLGRTFRVGGVQVSSQLEEGVAEGHVSGQRLRVGDGKGLENSASSGPVHRRILQFVRRPVGQRQAVVTGQRLHLYMVVVDGLAAGLDVQTVR